MQNNFRQRAGSRRGFTLVEIMVVVVILGLLATLVANNVIPFLFGAKIDKAKADIATISEAVELYVIKFRRNPEDLEDLVEPDENGDTILKNQTEVPLDPWYNEYVLEEDPERPGKFIIISYGEDGEPDTEDDITSVNMNQKDEE